MARGMVTGMACIDMDMIDELKVTKYRVEFGVQVA